MAIQFERREKIARYLDPGTGYQETRLTCELRRDPLTGRSGRIAHVTGFRLQPVDARPLIEASRAACPFCPERVLTVTPKFPADVVPGGRIQRGEAVAFPNLAPYDEHSVVVAMTQTHYVPMSQFTAPLLFDAFSACLEYFRHVQAQPRTPYALVFWNYLPPSGGTQIHPHLQVFATDTPGNALEEELAASARYAATEGRPFWADLIEAEERLGERFVARGTHSTWLTSFVSQSLLADTLIVVPEKQTLLELSEAAVEEFCRGLAQALAHLEAQGVYSFNLAWFPAVSGRDDFWLHARLSPRLYLTPRLWGSDTTALHHLYQEHFMVQSPESVAAAMRPAIHL